MDDEDNNANEDSNKNNLRPNFHVFTNPLDMERFFNQQMNEMIKSFGIFGSFRDEKGGNSEFPATDIPGNQERDRQNYSAEERGSREFMLKEDYDRKLKNPGYVAPETKMDSFSPDIGQKGITQQKKDKDLDKSGVASEDLNKLFKHQESPMSSGAVAPPFFDNWHKGSGSLFGQMFGNHFPFPDRIPRDQIPGNEREDENWTTHSFYFGHSSSQSKVQLPDGSTEERSETTDTTGNKVNKVTTTNPDGEWHCRVCVTKPSGNEECQDESSSEYQPTEDGSWKTVPGGIQVFGGHYGNLDPYDSHKKPGDGKDHPRNDMLKGEEKSYNSLFDKFFGRR